MEIYFLLAFSIVNLALAILAFYKIKNSPDKVEFIWHWGIFIGAFCWEDVFVYGILHSAIAGIALYQNSFHLWMIYYLVFWVVRSSGEAIYFFLQQFIEPKQHPHNIHKQINLFRKLFFPKISDQKAFIIFQIIHQSIVILSLIGLCNLL